MISRSSSLSSLATLIDAQDIASYMKDEVKKIL